MSANNVSDNDNGDEGDVTPPIETVGVAVDLSIRSSTSPDGINPSWSDFLSNSQANVGQPNYDATADTYSLATSDRFHQLKFMSNKGADALVDEDTVMMTLDSTSISDQSKKLSILDTLAMFNTSVSHFDDLMQKIINNIPKIATLSINTAATNACWLITGDRIQIVTQFHLTFDVQTAFDDMKKALADHFGFTMSIDASRWQDIEFITTQTIIGDPVDSTGTTFVLSTALDLTIKIPISGFIFWIRYSQGETNVSLTEDPRTSDGLFSRLSSLGDNDAPDSKSADPTTSWSDAFPTLHLWSASVGWGSGKSLWWQLRLLLVFQPDHNSTNQYLVGISYDSQMKTLSGSLLFSTAFPSNIQKRLPSYDPRDEPPPQVAVDALKDQYNIVSFFSDTSNTPAGLPSQIIQGSLTIGLPNSRAKPPIPASYSLALTAIAAAGSTGPPAVDDSIKVPAPFEWDQISLRAARIDSQTTLEIYTSFSINPKDPTKYSPATLWVDLKKDKVWELKGHADNLQFGALAEYFEGDFQDPILSVLGKFAINTLDIDYTFDSSQSASSFLMSGTVTLGQLELIFLYQYARSNEPKPAASKPENQKLLSDQGIEQLEVEDVGGKPQSNWSFEAVLGASTAGATVGTIADSIIDGASDKLPDFVKNIDITPASTGKGAVYLRLSKSTEGTVKQAVFTVKIMVSAFEVTFVQISSGSGKPKQLLRASVDPLPMIRDIPGINDLPIRDIPLLDHLAQPFDALAYLWVRDSNGTGGFTQSEVDAVNGNLPAGDKIAYKPLKSEKTEQGGAIVPSNATSSAQPIVMAVGHHFIVVDGGDAIVDHNFSNAKTGPKSTADQPSGQTPTNGEDPSPEPTEDTHDPKDTTTDAAPSKGAIKKSTPILSIDSIGLQFKDGVLWIMIDATVALGPVSMNLMGFGIGFPMSQFKLNKLSSLTGDDFTSLMKSIQWEIHGLGVAFEKPPLILAGFFDHEKVVVNGTSKESYRGGIAITFPPYVLVAVGEYSIIKTATDNYKSIFIYAKLDGPLVELEFGRISGVRLGFGYNSSVRSPEPNELTQFPFINDNGTGGAGNNPMKILNSMTEGNPPWVDAKRDAYWFALGMTITAFEVLSVTAVAMLAFKDSGIVVSIFADAIAQLPARDAPPAASILYVELVMMAEMNFVEGYFRVEAALAPTSFLLVPQCQLYGGFALCYWFGSSGHAGDFVFTIGGYHPAYQPPAWYPAVKRLGFSFTIGDMIQVTGEGYFAITPQVAMGGAMLHISLSVGPVSAYLDASFDAMINFSPLHYIADIRVSVGVECDIDFLFVHIHISCHVGADLHIEGPEFGGKAHVDFYFFGFDIYFGDTNHIPDPISLKDFYDLVLKLGPADGSKAQDDPGTTKYSNPNMDHIKFALEDGAFVMPQRNSKPIPSSDPSKPASDPSPNTGANTLWNVKGGTFQFRITCEIAISEAFINYPHVDDPAPVTPTDTATDPAPALAPPPPAFDTLPIIAKPALNPVYAKPMQLDPTKGDAAITSTLTVTIYNHDGGRIPDFQIKYLRKQVPASVWGPYSQGTDPNHASPQQVLGNTETTVELAMGLVIHSPPPRLEKGRLPAFNASAMAKLEVPMGIHRDASGAQVVDHWLLPDVDAEQTGGLPLAFDEAEIAKSPEDKWQEVQDTWNGAYTSDLVSGQKDQLGMLGVFGNVFGWNQALVGGVPEVLVGQKKDEGLVEYYLALPRLSEGVASVQSSSS